MAEIRSMDVEPCECGNSVALVMAVGLFVVTTPTEADLQKLGRKSILHSGG